MKLTNTKNGDKYLILAISIMIILGVFLSIRNEKIMDTGAHQTQFKVIKIFTKRKGITTSEKVADIKYLTEEGMINKRVQYYNGMIEGNCYKLEYSKNDIKLIKICSLIQEECTL